eukprot:GEMP01021219.1.p1 GENE.GEMP01021219.1~~GEMP01021219.1.p1  ORF type:complete len:382 (+),score=80.25 GEMP01021219.1:148-1293(+)
MPKGSRVIPEKGGLGILDPWVVTVAFVCGFAIWRRTPKLRALLVRRMSRWASKMTLPKLTSLFFLNSSMSERSTPGTSATPKPRKQKRQKNPKCKVEVVHNDFIAQKPVRSQPQQPAKEEVRTVEAKVSTHVHTPATSSTNFILVGKKRNKKKKLVAQRASSIISTVVPSTLGWSPSIVSLDTPEADICAMSPMLIPARRESHIDELVETALGMVEKEPSYNLLQSDHTTLHSSLETSSSMDEDVPFVLLSNEACPVMDKIETRCEVNEEEEIDSVGQATTAVVEDRDFMVTKINEVEHTVKNELGVLAAAEAGVQAEVEICMLESIEVTSGHPEMRESSRFALEKHLDAIGDFDEIRVKNTFIHLMFDEHVATRRMSCVY